MDHPEWHAVPAAELAGWSERLLRSGASLFQLPYWTEPLRQLRLSPVHLVWRDRGTAIAWASVLRFGLPGAYVGLVQRGPVSLVDGTPVPGRASMELVQWAARHGIFCLRFTHESERALEAVAAHPRARRLDPFPWYRDPREALLVPQDGDDDAVLARFQPLARRKIRKGSAEGYHIDHSAAPDALRDAWPLFQRLAARKGFSYRPLESFLHLLRLAAPVDGARVYTAWLGGVPVQAILVARDGCVAHYICGALDVEAIGHRESPSALLHWRAMRDFARLGAMDYDLGTRSGEVYQFKRIFHPCEVVFPAPVAVVTNRALFGAFAATALRIRGERWRRLKRVLSRMLGAMYPPRGAPPAPAAR
ncbi:MAG TPA: GNAT family N-acetyltransferase [Gemmatimonadaceae bacterium]|nr:GNAT family N-acetyltransferase [Gemmatimonadaceae bacterium]